MGLLLNFWVNFYNNQFHRSHNSKILKSDSVILKHAVNFFFKYQLEEQKKELLKNVEELKER